MSDRPQSARRKAPAPKVATSNRGRPRQPRALREARDALYREHIMEAAEGIFAEQGFANTRMQDIARAAGISLGTLYQAHHGKSELYRAILIERDADMLNTLMSKGQHVLQQPQSIEQLLWLMALQLGFMLDHPNFLRMQLQGGQAWYHNTAWPSHEEQQIWERGMKVMSALFGWGMAKGLFVPGVPEDQARMVLAMQQARLTNWVSAGMQEAHAVVIERIQADFVRNICTPSVALPLLSREGDCLAVAARERIRAFSLATG